MASPYITVAGPIGAGKSTLAAALSKKLGYPCFLESAGERNPFLEGFYENRRKFAFRSQTYFIVEALRQQQEIAKLTGGALQDRSIWEHIHIFATGLLEEKALSAEEFELLRELAAVGSGALPEPDLMIFLEAAPKLLKERIGKRGREYEKEISSQRLKDSIELYERWLSGWDASPILRLDASSFDPSIDADLGVLLERIAEKLPEISQS